LVDVLTKDIDIVAAILDLVDNSVDAARRQRGDEKLTGLQVDVEFSANRLKITDNCGGISLEDAEERVFRFGPDDDDPPDAFTTGQFGVGLKRALFKLGTGFVIRSVAEQESFEVRETLERWLGRRDDWSFKISKLRREKHSATKRGTTITIQPLRKTIAAELARTEVVNELSAQVADRHQISITRGLKIKVNGSALRTKPPKVVADNKIMPLIDHASINGKADLIGVRIVCGVAPGPQREAGWSVFLNDRAVLLADKTAATGWGEDDEKRIPRFHGQYGRFRGFAFLECEDTTRLPWNTTKTGLDSDDAVYRRVRSMMVDAADPVVDFLDEVKGEGKPEGDRYGALRTSIEKGKLRSVFELAEAGTRRWKAPQPTEVAPEPEETTRVYTDRPPDDVEELKELTATSSNKELGDFLWEYFVERET
jgi:hypothetical protein